MHRKNPEDIFIPYSDPRITGDGQKTRNLNTESIRRANEIARKQNETTDKPPEKK